VGLPLTVDDALRDYVTHLKIERTNRKAAGGGAIVYGIDF